MATSNLAAMPAINTQLEQLLSSLTTGTGTGTKQSQTVDSGLLGILQGLTSNLGGSDFSKSAAVSDISGVVNTLARQALEQSRPAQAEALRSAGLRDSTTASLLQNDADARIQGELAKVIQANIASYGQLQQGQVQAAANATNASRQTNATSTGDQIKNALLQGAIGLGGTAIKELGTKYLRDLGLSSAGSAASSAVDMTGFYTPATAGGLSFGSSAASSLGSGTFGLENNFGLGENIFSGGDSIFSGLGDLASGAFDSITSGLSSAGDFIGDFASGIGDFLGNLFEDGGRIPKGYESGGKVTNQGNPATDPQAALKAFMQTLQDPAGNPKRLAEQRATEISQDSPMLQSLFQALGLLPSPQPAQSREDGGKISGGATSGVIDGKPAPHIGDNKQAKVNGTPVGLRGGEYIIPTDVVDLVGEDVFDAIVKAYHTPRTSGKGA